MDYKTKAFVKYDSHLVQISIKYNKHIILYNKNTEELLFLAFACESFKKTL